MTSVKLPAIVAIICLDEEDWERNLIFFTTYHPDPEQVVGTTEVNIINSLILHALKHMATATVEG